MNEVGEPVHEVWKPVHEVWAARERGRSSPCTGYAQPVNEVDLQVHEVQARGNTRVARQGGVRRRALVGPFATLRRHSVDTARRFLHLGRARASGRHQRVMGRRDWW